MAASNTNSATVLFWVLLWLVMLTIVTTESIHHVTVNHGGDLTLENTNIATADGCKLELSNLTTPDESESPFEGISFAIHRNGQTQTCGAVTSDIFAMERAIVPFDRKCNNLTKYDVESFLTVLFADQLGRKKCRSKKKSRAAMGFYGYCDMGPARTAELMDYDDLVRVPNGSLPCRFFTREGVRIKSLVDLVDLARNAKEAARICARSSTGCDWNSTAIPKVHLYAVPASRVFMFAPSFVGEVFDLSHVQVGTGPTVSLEVLSVNPRVFDLKNFFSKEEAENLIQEALNETQPEMKLKRSFTGYSQDHIIETRTSESGWPAMSALVLKIIKRAFLAVGFEDTWLGHADGIQVLRYNETKAYIPHMDYMHDPDGTHLFDYDSAKKGGNRYATILLYMSDPVGGETVFSEAWPPSSSEQERILLHQAIEQLRASGEAKMLEEGSWEEEMVATCRTRLAVRPKFGRAVLFYSQHPDGKVDAMSKHGGCPVLHGVKWAANLWLWNTPRFGFIKAPLKDKRVVPRPQQNSPQLLHATFSNAGTDPAFRDAELFYEDSFWGKLGHHDPPLFVNTYEGHRWNVKVDKEIVKSFIIGSDDQQAYFV